MNQVIQVKVKAVKVATEEGRENRFAVSVSRNGNAWNTLAVYFPTEQAAQNVAQAILDNSRVTA